MKHRIHSNGYARVYQPDHLKADCNGYIQEHTLIAEKALGKPLPPGVVVHHHGTKSDQTQIVICENRAYHNLLHRRIRAFKACGHANWRKCAYCKQYDKPENLYIGCNLVCHQQCCNKYRRELTKRHNKKKGE